MLRNQRFKTQKAIGIQDLEDMEMRSYGKELVNEINFVSFLYKRIMISLA